MEMIHWGGVTCCLGAAALYLLGRISGRDAELLKSSSRVNHLKDLAKLLDAEKSPLVVTISGRVDSKTPIKCKFSDLRAVIVEETAEQHFLKQNDAGSWIRDSALMLSTSKEVPWHLDDGTDLVRVVGAQGATDFALPVVTDAYEQSSRSIVRGALDYLQGVKMVGVKRIERVLPVGSSLTVVGEVAKDDVGTIRIQRPHKGPFYVSPKTIDQLIVSLGKWARLFKYASIGLTLFGGCLIAKHAIQHILERRRLREMQRRVLAAAAQRRLDSEGEMADSLAEGNMNDRMPDLCVICLDQDYNAVFVPCGHLCCCIACSSRLTSCPICRGQIERVVKTYRH